MDEEAPTWLWNHLRHYVCVLWQHECHKLVKKSGSTLEIEAYQDPVPLHPRLGRGEDCVSRVYQHWQPEGKHIY